MPLRYSLLSLCAQAYILTYICTYICLYACTEVSVHDYRCMCACMHVVAYTLSSDGTLHLYPAMTIMRYGASPSYYHCKSLLSSEHRTEVRLVKLS